MFLGRDFDFDLSSLGCFSRLDNVIQPLVQRIHNFKTQFTDSLFSWFALGYVTDIQIGSEYSGITDFKQWVIKC